ncbi:UNVERIFIED_CONTAM: hypothetical protein Sangu_2200400 [Sesamum angustifolium]|uniref:Uncharacterized protein n=1 Tax=Sesamum angustifolium TaxID=2727405 RepID=A0AAW2LJG1_9LAMI
MLTTHCKELHALANALLEHETLMGSQIKAVLAQSKAGPPSTPNVAASAAPKAAAAATRAKAIAPVGS